MSKRTIEAFEKVVAKQAEEDRPALFVGCHCPHCALTWIICEMPQTMGVLAELAGKHKHCPSCQQGDLGLAHPTQIRALLRKGER